MRGTVLLLAAGSGSRLGAGRPKAFVRLAGTTLLRRSADAAAGARLVDGLVVAVPPDVVGQARAELDGLPVPHVVVAGGRTRQDSARAALEAASAGAVAVHDAARPLCPPELFDACLHALDAAEAAVVAVPVADTLKVVREGRIAATQARDGLYAVQTPQAFRVGVYRRAHESALADGFVGTDDAALVERIGVAVRVLAGSPLNTKITGTSDLALAEALLAARTRT